MAKKNLAELLVDTLSAAGVKRVYGLAGDFALAIRSGMRATDLKHMLFAYPTSGSNMTRML